MNSQKHAKKENMWANLLINIVIPTLILVKLANEKYLGPQLAVVIALAFPISYGLYDLIKAKKVNYFSALGVLSVAFTGGMSLLKVPVEYFAIKEAAIPALLALIILGSMKTPYPIVKKLVYSDAVFDIERIEASLLQNNNTPLFQRCLDNASFLLALSFVVSAILNYGLAKYILVSEPGTEAFTQELGKMTALSFPVITIPSLSIMFFGAFYLFKSIKRLTGLSFEDIFVNPDAAAPEEAVPPPNEQK